MGSIVLWLVGKGVSERFARPLAYAGLILLLIAAFFGGKALYDRSVISRHEAKQEAATAKADRKADNEAAEQRRIDDSRLNQEAQELEKAQANAKSDLDRRLAKHRCLRAQQQARAEQRQPPACA